MLTKICLSIISYHICYDYSKLFNYKYNLFNINLLIVEKYFWAFLYIFLQKNMRKSILFWRVYPSVIYEVILNHILYVARPFSDEFVFVHIIYLKSINNNNNCVRKTIFGGTRILFSFLLNTFQSCALWTADNFEKLA